MTATLAGWIDAACALCGSKERVERFRDGIFGVYRCTSCGLVYVSPRREQGELLREVYDESYWRSGAARDRGYADYLADEPLWRRTWERRIAALELHLPAPGRALDVGCASGLFLEALARRGWQVTGIEPSPGMRERARARLGQDRVIDEPLESARLERGAFDLVTLWDVLEHLCDPLGALVEIASALSPRGRLLVLTQDVSSWLERALGRRWHHYKHDEHLVHFDARTLGLALGRAGLRAVRVTRRGTGKWVDWRFVVERSARLSRALPPLLARLAPMAPRALYVNPRDELLVLAARAAA